MITAEKVTAMGYLLGRLTMSPTDKFTILDELSDIVEAQEEAQEEAQP